MELLFPELQLQSGESGVVKGLVALNRAQDLFEVHAAQYGDIFGGSVSTITTTLNQEYTTYPTGLMRLDGIDFLDQSSNLPAFELTPLTWRGSHAFAVRWPWAQYLVSTAGNSSGQPRFYWTNGTRIYWGPVPDAAYNLRVYGFVAASDISAAGTFGYPDAAILPFAAVAVQIIRTGLDDTLSDLQNLATETFNSLLDQLSGFRRDGAQDLVYSRVHDT